MLKTGLFMLLGVSVGFVFATVVADRDDRLDAVVSPGIGTDFPSVNLTPLTERVGQLESALADEIALRESLQAFMDKTNESVTGTAKVKLYKGRAQAVSVQSPWSLYDTKLASFAMDGYDVTAARGFIDLFGLPMQVHSLKHQSKSD